MPQITIGKGLAFYEEAQALPGVKRVAGMVKQDIELVTGVSPAGITSGQGSGCAVLYGTIGHSPMLDALEAQGKIALNAIRGKWECYSFQVIENPLAGISTALKVFPVTANFENSEERPYLEYTFAAALLRQRTETIMYSSICPPPRRSPLSQSSISVIRSMAERYRL